MWKALSVRDELSNADIRSSESLDCIAFQSRLQDRYHAFLPISTGQCENATLWYSCEYVVYLSYIPRRLHLHGHAFHQTDEEQCQDTL